MGVRGGRGAVKPLCWLRQGMRVCRPTDEIWTRDSRVRPGHGQQQKGSLCYMHTCMWTWWMPIGKKYQRWYILETLQKCWICSRILLAIFPTLLQPYLSPIYTKDNNYKVLVITLILWEFCWNRFLNLFFSWCAMKIGTANQNPTCYKELKHLNW